jgi:hypothetical protein
MDPELMSWVGICMTACLAHDSTDCRVVKKIVRSGVFAIDTKRFLLGNSEIRLAHLSTKPLPSILFVIPP